MTERLVGVGARLHRDGIAGGGRIGGVAVRGGSSVGAKGLVCVGGLLGGHATSGLVLVVVRRLAGAAARADHPEQTGSQGEGDSQPGSHVDILAHAALNAVVLQVLVEGTGNGREHRGRSNRSGSGEQESDLSSSVSILYDTEENKTESKHTPETRVVTQLPQRLQIAKTPTTSSTTVATKATM